MKKFGLAACAALALTATSASANGYWQDGVYYSYPTTTQTYTAPTYTTPGNNVTGTVGPARSTYTQPSTYTSAYSQPTYTAPTYATPGYTAPTTQYVPPQGKPIYAPAPSYVVPDYAPHQQYDGRDRVRDRIRNQRNRIERALERGDLRRGEERRLREGLREIRWTFRSYRDNDGYIGRHEETQLIAMLNRNSKRIRRLANNDRVAGHPNHTRYPY